MLINVSLNNYNAEQIEPTCSVQLDSFLCIFEQAWGPQ